MKEHLVSMENVGLVLGEGEGRTEILKDISLSILHGEFVSLMGPSGAGKSSLMNVAGGLLTPSSGKVIVDGFDVYALDGEKRADFRRVYVGFVFQSFHLFPYLTVRENVMLPMINGDVSRDEMDELASELLGKVGLGGKERRFPSQLSGGEAQRVAIARALFNDPSIILADEPTGNLDSKSGGAILDLFHHLNQEGKTILMVTHSREYARIAHRIVEMQDGMLKKATLNTHAAPAYR